MEQCPTAAWLWLPPTRRVPYAPCAISPLVPIARAYVAGNLHDHHERALLEQELAEIDGKRRQFGEMSQFLRAKLRDLSGQ